jgi:alpha-L-rhamnosidase
MNYDERLRLAFLLVLLFGFTALLCQRSATVQQTTSAQNIADLQRLFQNPPDDSKIMMRWWWFGPAVTKPQLEREMRLMKEGGIGGFEVQPVYPLVLDDATAGIKTLPFLSDQFIDALRFTSDKAREFGLRFDLTLGSGWPYGGPQVSVNQAAGRLRTERVKVADNLRRVPLPDIGAGEKLLAVFLARIEGQSITADSLREITEIRDGAARLPEGLQGQYEVLFFISSRTGMMVKRPSVGAEGFVLDHYDRAAIDHYLKTTGDRLMEAFGEHPPYAVFCDSLEVFNSDWTPDLLAEFQRRRGYDLKPLLPALVADIGPHTAAIRHDWGQTLTELLNERFLAPMRDWSKRHRTLFRIQGYGIPPATISSNASADLTEGEGPQWKVLRASRWASSANHLYGRQVTSSETWTWLHSPSFRATPLDVKAEADLHFLQGINQLIGHGWPYTAENVEYPGWRFYAAGVFNEKNPWWIVMPDLARYLQRISFLLRQGRPANDVALYLPNSDAWAHFVNGRVHYMIDALRDRIGPDVLAKTLEAGFNLDLFDDEALRQIGRVEKDQLALGTNRYKIVILPNVERIPLDTLRRLEEFARGGGVLIATRRTPNLAPGYKATANEQDQIREISRRLFDGESPPAHLIQDEKVQLGSKLTSLLQPDLRLSPAVPEIGFIRRHTDSAEIYFIANSSNVRQNVKATFRVRGMNAEIWNPFTGSAAPAESEQQADNGVTVTLDLEPYGSRVVVFTKRALPPLQARTQSPHPSPLDLSSGWRVSFGQRTSAPISMDKLRSWTEDEETRYFSGTAVYEKDVVVPESLLQSEREVRLDFGDGQPLPVHERRNGIRAWLDPPIREAAVVYVNDVRAGSVWCPPYSIDVTRLLKRGENRIRIMVGNTAINYLSGRKLPDYKLLNLRYGERFQAQDMENLLPLPSGLIGGVRLIAR